MKSLIIVNPADCIGCRTCEVACVVAHPSEQELNADIFLPRLKVQRRLSRGGADDGRAGGAGKFCPLYWLSELRQCVPVWNDHHSVIAGGYPATNREMRSL